MSSLRPRRRGTRPRLPNADDRHPHRRARLERALEHSRHHRRPSHPCPTQDAERPIPVQFGLFWFGDDGNPHYTGSDYDTTIKATFTDTAGGIGYTDLQVAYDDQLYNTVTINRQDGVEQTRTDAASVSAYGPRGYTATDLILATDADASLTAAGILEGFSQPLFRATSITLNGASPGSTRTDANCPSGRGDARNCRPGPGSGAPAGAAVWGGAAAWDGGRRPTPKTRRRRRAPPRRAQKR
ncbi:MAG: hypothetical protein ACRDP6_06245 [Actinoallomurus sp.]